MTGDEEELVGELSEPVRAALDAGVRAGASRCWRSSAIERGGTSVMSDIRVSPVAQLAPAGRCSPLVVALIAAQAPEIQRYLKIRSM